MSASHNTADVIVVGGGPAGASASFALARAGVDVIVLDRAHFPRPKPCAECLSVEAARILHRMGVLGAVEQSGAARLRGMVIRAPSGDRIIGDFAGAHRWTPFRERSLAVRREVLDPLLLCAARDAGARVSHGVRVTDVVRDSRGRALGVRALAPEGERTYSARIVIGADGLRSVVAKRLGLSRKPLAPRRLALVSHYEGVANMGEYGEMHVERDGFVGIADVGHGVTTVAMVVPASRAPDISGDSAQFMDAWLAAHHQLAPRFAHAHRVSPVSATGPFATRARRAWAPGALLVGDAADFFDPFTGEGIYAALRGGEIAADFIREALGAPSDRAADRALTGYARARRRELGGKWIVERLIGAAVGSPVIMNRAARTLATHKSMADVIVGVTNHVVPASEVLNPRYLLRLFFSTSPT